MQTRYDRRTIEWALVTALAILFSAGAATFWTFRVLIEGNGAVARNTHAAIFFIVVGDTLAIGLLLAAAAATRREIKARSESELKLEESVRQLTASNRELEQFAYVASHDLQEPLRMISNYCQLLRQRYHSHLDADADEFIGFAVEGARRMQTLIDDLLAYSRVGTRGEKLVPTSADAALQTALENLQTAIAESGAVITRDSLPVVLADATQLTQLFQNLVANAIKFRRNAAPRVHISVRKNKADWLIGVRDNGIGIAPEYQKQIFVIFQRLHSREEYPGTGIGLAICRKIVERHGGSIWVESHSAEGAIFYFTLPG